MELGVNGHEYGMLVEGDFGRLTFQGTRYISFERSDSKGLDIRPVSPTMRFNQKQRKNLWLNPQVFGFTQEIFILQLLQFSHYTAVFSNSAFSHFIILFSSRGNIGL